VISRECAERVGPVAVVPQCGTVPYGETVRQNSLGEAMSAGK
jgi:hypothetical protein